MNLTGIDVLERAAKKHPAARANLQSWRQIVSRAGWPGFSATRQTYPHADRIVLPSGRAVTVFNIGQKFRLIAIVDYDAQAVRILELLTHPEYDKKAWVKRW